MIFLNKVFHEIRKKIYHHGFGWETIGELWFVYRNKIILSYLVKNSGAGEVSKA